MDKAEFLELYTRYKQSKQSLANFLDVEKIKIPRYYYFKRKYMDNPSKQIQTKGHKKENEVGDSNSVMTIIYPNGVRVVIEIGMTADVLRTMILV